MTVWVTFALYALVAACGLALAHALRDIAEALRDIADAIADAIDDDDHVQN